MALRLDHDADPIGSGLFKITNLAMSVESFIDLPSKCRGVLLIAHDRDMISCHGDDLKAPREQVAPSIGGEPRRPRWGGEGGA